LTHIAYPLSDIWRLLDGAGPPPAGLEGLLGSQRALILRRLDRPFTAGRIAELLFAVPSAASHHIAILERAGLVARELRSTPAQTRSNVTRPPAASTAATSGEPCWRRCCATRASTSCSAKPR
jgi:DNA-binding transcriptional ArsR family regulator